MNKKQLEDKTFAYALKNALAHGGKATQGPIIAALFNEGLKKEDMKKYGALINEIVTGVNKIPLMDQQKEFDKLNIVLSERKVRVGLPELPKAKKGKVIMRFAPSASGPMHIGHAMTSCLSFLFVKKYGGKFYVRIEDTNPENIYKPAYNMIEKEAKWLFDNQVKIIIQSDRMDLYYKYAKVLIRKKVAYVCTCTADEFRDYSKRKKNCPCRAFNITDNLEAWDKMLDKSGFKVGEAVLRFKSSEGMKHKNPAMRDFPLARINETPHPRTKKAYRVWPLMNLAVTVDDIEMKMTHIVRAKDHRDNALRQEMMYKVLKKRAPWTGFLGRYKFKDMDLSTTKMREAIEAGKYTGWDDPKLPTLASLKKQGYTPQAFWKFAERVGLSENDKLMDKKEYFTLLKNFNKI